MPTPTYFPIATQTLGSAASTITFSSIPQAYTDLRIVLSNIVVSSAGQCYMKYNAIASGYAFTQLGGNGTTLSSTGVISNGNLPLQWLTNNSTTIPSSISIDIFSYAGTTNKTCLITNAQDYNGSGVVEILCGLSTNTAAITTVILGLGGGGNFNTGTIATIWGI